MIELFLIATFFAVVIMIVLMDDRILQCLRESSSMRIGFMQEMRSMHRQLDNIQTELFDPINDGSETADHSDILRIDVSEVTGKEEMDRLNNMGPLPEKFDVSAMKELLKV